MDKMPVPNLSIIRRFHCIPQTECLQIIYDEMYKRRHLVLMDPNVIIQLLQVNVNYNYFSFAGLCFQQTHGTAMGAAFSPTIANIFLSVTLSRFLQTQETKPVLLTRYIDDIFVIWPKKKPSTTSFQNSTNSTQIYNLLMPALNLQSTFLISPYIKALIFQLHKY